MTTAHQVRPYGPDVSTDQRYEIRLGGRLADRWSAWFDGFDLTVEGDATVLRGEVADQAALHGVLHKVRDLGIPLISLTALPVAPPRHDQPGATT